MTISSVATAFLRHLPISSEYLGPPKRWVADTEDWIASGGPPAVRSRLHRIVPSFTAHRPWPGALDEPALWPFRTFYGGSVIHDPGAWVAEIPGGRVVGNGAVIAPDDCLLADVSRELIVGGDQSRHSVLRRRWLRPARRVPGRVAVLSVTDINYWHWCFDLLPRIVLLQQMPGGLDSIDAFVVNGFRHAYQEETLARLGIPAAKIVQSDPYYFHIKADLLLVPSVFTEVPARWACRSLRAQLGHPVPARGDRRLFVSRADARIRHIANEDALLAALAPYGFERVVLRGMSVREQAELFSAAELVVAPHGAGLTNLLFCPPGAGVIEIFPPNYVNPCYWVLATHLDLHYQYLVGAGSVPPEPPPGVNAGEWFWSFVEAHQTSQDIVARTDDLVRLLERALPLRAI